MGAGGGGKIFSRQKFPAIQVLGGTYMSLRDDLFVEPDESSRAPSLISREER